MKKWPGYVLNVNPPGIVRHNSILIRHATWGTWLTSACLAARASPRNIWFFRRQLRVSKIAGYPGFPYCISWSHDGFGPTSFGYFGYPRILSQDIPTTFPHFPHFPRPFDRPRLSNWPSSWWKFDKTSEVWRLNPRYLHHHLVCDMYHVFVWSVDATKTYKNTTWCWVVGLCSYDLLW